VVVVASFTLVDFRVVLELDLDVISLVCVFKDVIVALNVFVFVRVRRFVEVMTLVVWTVLVTVIGLFIIVHVVV